MEKFYRLNKPVYHKADGIRVSDHYDKKLGGYTVQCEVVELISTDNGILYGKLFCPEYYNMGGDGYTMIAESGRRNAKKEALAVEEVKANARAYAESYIEHINSELQIVEEV